MPDDGNLFTFSLYLPSQSFSHSQATIKSCSEQTIEDIFKYCFLQWTGKYPPNPPFVFRIIKYPATIAVLETHANDSGYEWTVQMNQTESQTISKTCLTH